MSEPPLIPQRPSHKVDSTPAVPKRPASRPQQSSSPAVPTAHPLKSSSPSTVPIAADVPPKIPLNRPSRNLTFEDSPAAAASSPEVPTTRPTHSIPDCTPEPVYDQQYEDMVLPKIPATRPVRASPSPVPASSQPRVPATRPVRPPSVDPRPEQTEAVLEQPKIPTSRPARKTNEQPIEEDASVVESVVSGLKDENNPILVAPTPISAQSNLNNVNSVEENVATASFKSGISPEFSTAAIPLASSVKSDLVKEEANFVKEVVPELVTPSIPSTRPAKVSPPVESFKPEIEKQTPLADELKSATPIVPSRPVKATTPVQDSRPETEVEQKETILEDAKPITPVVPSRPVKATTPVQDSRPETEVEQKETILEDAKQITPVVPSRPANVNPAKPIEHEDIKEGIINASVNLAKTPQVPIQPPVPSKRPSRVVPTEDVGAVESVKKIDDFDNVDSAQVEKNDVSKDSVKNAESETLVPTTKVIESQILSETKPESKESAVSEEKHEDNVEEKVEEKPQAPSTRPSRSPEANLPEAPARPATRPKPTRPPSSDNAKVPPPVPAHKPLPPGGVPPRPKKLTSTATMFERQATSPPAAPTKPKPPAKMNKVGALRASLFKDLDSMISRGGIPPPMGIPKPSAASGGSEDKNGDSEEIKPKEEEKKLTDVRRGRAKGPKRKLPSAATKSLVADTAAPTATVATVKLESFVGGDVWSVGGRNLEISQEEEEKRLKQEEEERLRKLEEERLRKLEEERLRKEEEERLKKEEEERLRKEEEERLRKEEEERLRKVEEERLKKEEEERLKKEEEARLKKEEEARLKKEEEKRLKREEEERLKKEEEEARLKEEEEARLKEEEEARQKEEEEEARLKAEKEKQLEKEKEESQLKKIEEENNKRAEEISEEEKETQDATQLNQIKDPKKGEHSDSDLGELKSVDEESTLKPVVVSKDMEVSKTADDELASVANPTATIIDNKAKSLGIPASLESVQPILITTKTPLREESFNSKSETIGASTNSISRSEIVQSAEDSDSEPEILETISIAKPVAFNLEEPAETVTAAKPVTVSVEEPEIVAVQSFETDSVTKPVKDEVFELAPKSVATFSGTAQATVVTSKNDNSVAPESE